MPTTPELVVLDMAGTTVTDGGLVEAAFTEAVAAQGVGETDERYPAMLTYVRATMGESKISVFRHLFGGDEAAARRGNTDFEAAYAARIDAVAPIPGADETIAGLRAAGIKVALTTGFSRPTADAILTALDWIGLADLTLVPAEAGRGRPYPDLVLTAVLRLGASDLRRVVTCGDTTYDVLTGLRAGAGTVTAVTTGAHTAADLAAAGAHHVLDSVTALPDLLHS
ncbi:phosphonatase-like hydrolase [Phytomonospora endophytica]|uniref:Phosphonatase-like hydrolase n=1 Tax=Phytomonospora endophytica TaxID=714109 RepID=A0A841FTX3_9ACTN|nr:phosphonatase-like hydrolase [Phytomonospora endophytica]MBB6035979.1 phosphonatase-like hydrolase [Phytomonospora endophytica]GIG66885.1 putative haloacid dehalogenase-like hydrolase [Phytomonospora endophytica]